MARGRGALLFSVKIMVVVVCMAVYWSENLYAMDFVAVHDVRALVEQERTLCPSVGSVRHDPLAAFKGMGISALFGSGELHWVASRRIGGECIDDTQYVHDRIERLVQGLLGWSSDIEGEMSRRCSGIPVEGQAAMRQCIARERASALNGIISYFSTGLVRACWVELFWRVIDRRSAVGLDALMMKLRDILQIGSLQGFQLTPAERTQLLAYVRANIAESEAWRAVLESQLAPCATFVALSCCVSAPIPIPGAGLGQCLAAGGMSSDDESASSTPPRTIGFATPGSSPASSAPSSPRRLKQWATQVRDLAAAIVARGDEFSDEEIRDLVIEQFPSSVVTAQFVADAAAGVAGTAGDGQGGE